VFDFHVDGLISYLISIMMIISIFITLGVTTLPFERNFILRFMKGVGAQEPIKDALIVEKRGCRDSWKEENFLMSHAAFLSNDGSNAPCRI
jgi:hypothetical protein